MLNSRGRLCSARVRSVFFNRSRNTTLTEFKVLRDRTVWASPPASWVHACAAVKRPKGAESEVENRSEGVVINEQPTLALPANHSAGHVDPNNHSDA